MNALYCLYRNKGTKQNRMLLFDEKQKGNRIAYKEKKLYITYIVKKRKGYKRAQKKEGLKKPL